MPSARQITEIEQEIAGVHAAIETIRAQKAQASDLDRLLGELARLRAERTRLMLRHTTIVSGK